MGEMESVESALARIIVRAGSQSPIVATDGEWTALNAAINAKNVAMAEEMPDEKAALSVMFRAWERLKQLGWSEAIYCPKDGSTFDAIEAGSTGIHSCHYEGDWPNGTWWVSEAGDLWPSRPILWRPASKEAAIARATSQPHPHAGELS